MEVFMSNEKQEQIDLIKRIIYYIVTYALIVAAPFLVWKAIKDYKKTSQIYGESDKSIVVSTYIEPSQYLYQENLSNIVLDKDDTSNSYIYAYNFAPKSFDSSQHSYAVFINDYLCSTTELEVKSISVQHKSNFEDASKNVICSMTIDIEFEFYSTYSKLVFKLKTDDISYFNAFKENPGIVLTLTEINNDILQVSKPNTSASVKTVTFKDDNGKVLETFYVESGKKLNLTPQNPSKVGYEFKGWSINGTDIVEDINSIVNEDLIYIAIFEQLPITGKTFVSQNWNIDNFNGCNIWSEGSNTYYSAQTEQYILNKDTLNWEIKTWNGLNDFSGYNIWSDGTNTYYSYNNNHYVLDTVTSTWSPKTWYGINYFSGDDIFTDGTNYYTNAIIDGYYSDSYVLDKSSSKWTKKSWISYDDNSGKGWTPSDHCPSDVIWKIDDNLYFSRGSKSEDHSYFNKSSKYWQHKNWYGLDDLDHFYASYIWSDGNKTYYSQGSNQYVLDLETSTWTKKFWNTSIDGNNIWTDGTNYYYSKGTEHYILITPTN